MERIKVEANAKSPTQANDLAMAEGRSLAWRKLFRRLTLASRWASQPHLSDDQLLALIGSIVVEKERRSTTRYLAEVTFHFRPGPVRHLLRRSHIVFTETRSEPMLVIPLTAGKKGLDLKSPWAAAWARRPQQDLVPMVVPQFDSGMVLPANIAELNWTAWEPMVRRYNAEQIIVAIASEDAKSVQMIELSPAGRTSASFAYTQSSFEADAEAIAEQAANSWKEFLERPKPALSRADEGFADDGSRAHLTANVRFRDAKDWMKLRAQLSAVKPIIAVQLLGLSLHDADLDLTYFGPTEQLRAALAQQNLVLGGNRGEYALELVTTTALR